MLVHLNVDSPRYLPTASPLLDFLGRLRFWGQKAG